MNLMAFGNSMRDDMKVKKFQTPSKRTYYRNIALRSTLWQLANLRHPSGTSMSEPRCIECGRRLATNQHAVLS